jgi:hypothetical protein
MAVFAALARLVRLVRLTGCIGLVVSVPRSKRPCDRRGTTIRRAYGSACETKRDEEGCTSRQEDWKATYTEATGGSRG